MLYILTLVVFIMFQCTNCNPYESNEEVYLQKYLREFRDMLTNLTTSTTMATMESQAAASKESNEDTQENEFPNGPVEVTIADSEKNYDYMHGFFGSSPNDKTSSPSLLRSHNKESIKSQERGFNRKGEQTPAWEFDNWFNWAAKQTNAPNRITDILRSKSKYNYGAQKPHKIAQHENSRSSEIPSWIHPHSYVRKPAAAPQAANAKPGNYRGKTNFDISKLTPYQKALYNKMDALKMGAFSVSAIEICRIMTNKTIQEIDRVRSRVFDYLTENTKKFTVFGKLIYYKLVEILSMINFLKNTQLQKTSRQIHNSLLHRRSNISKEMNDVIETADEFFSGAIVATRLFSALEKFNMYPKTTSAREGDDWNFDLMSYIRHQRERDEPQYRRADDDLKPSPEEELVKIIFDSVFEPLITAAKAGEAKFKELKQKLTNILNEMGENEGKKYIVREGMDVTFPSYESRSKENSKENRNPIPTVSSTAGDFFSIFNPSTTGIKNVVRGRKEPAHLISYENRNKEHRNRIPTVSSTQVDLFKTFNPSTYGIKNIVHKVKDLPFASYESRNKDRNRIPTVSSTQNDVFKIFNPSTYGIKNVVREGKDLPFASYESRNKDRNPIPIVSSSADDSFSIFNPSTYGINNIFREGKEPASPSYKSRNKENSNPFRFTTYGYLPSDTTKDLIRMWDPSSYENNILARDREDKENRNPLPAAYGLPPSNNKEDLIKTSNPENNIARERKEPPSATYESSNKENKNPTPTVSSTPEELFSPFNPSTYGIMEKIATIILPYKIKDITHNIIKTNKTETEIISAEKLRAIELPGENENNSTTNKSDENETDSVWENENESSSNDNETSTNQNTRENEEINSDFVNNRRVYNSQHNHKEINKTPTKNNAIRRKLLSNRLIRITTTDKYDTKLDNQKNILKKDKIIKKENSETSSSDNREVNSLDEKSDEMEVLRGKSDKSATDNVKKKEIRRIAEGSTIEYSQEEHEIRKYLKKAVKTIIT